jgi:DNA-binding MarR family transcriptional regulator
MAMIGERGRISVTELASLGNVRAPTMSRMTSSLVEDGLARKTGHKEDGRGVLISLTPKGKRVLNSANRKSVQYIRQALSSLSASEVEALSELVSKLAETR